MSEQARFNVLRVKLDDASDRRALHNAGHVFQVIQASSNAAEMSLTINEPDGKRFEVREGFGWQHSPYTGLYVTHDAQPGEWMDVLIGGDPGQAKSEYFRVFAVSNASSVTIDGQADDVDVNVTNTQLDINIAQADAEVDVNLTNPTELEAIPKFRELQSSNNMSGLDTYYNTTSTTFVAAFTVPAGKYWNIHSSCFAGTGPAYLAVKRGGKNILLACSMRSTSFGGDPSLDGVRLQAGDSIWLRSGSGSITAQLWMAIEEGDM